MDEPKIKPQLKLFALNYLGKHCGNAEQSAIAAGYSKNYSRASAHKLLKRADVCQYIAYIREQKNVPVAIMTVEEVQTFWSDTIKNKGFSIKERLRASELLAKAQGQFSNDSW